MHLTQTVPSERILATNEVSYTRIAPSGTANGPAFKRSVLSIEGDQRLARLYERMRSEIALNHWKPSHDEKQICERLVGLLSSPDYFGPYDEAALNSKAKVEARDSRHSLKEFPTGNLNCREQALVTAVTLQRLGIANDFCAGPTLVGGKARGHAFVQTLSGNIVEATNPVFSFYKSLNHEMLRDGKIAVVESVSGNRQFYGGGKMGALDSICYTFSKHKIDLLEHAVIGNVAREVQSMIEGAVRHGR